MNRNWRGCETLWVQGLPSTTTVVTSAMSVSGNKSRTCSTCLPGAGPERRNEIRLGCRHSRHRAGLRLPERQHPQPAPGRPGGRERRGRGKCDRIRRCNEAERGRKQSERGRKQSERGRDERERGRDQRKHGRK